MQKNTLDQQFSVKLAKAGTFFTMTCNSNIFFTVMLWYKNTPDAHALLFPIIANCLSEKSWGKMHTCIKVERGDTGFNSLLWLVCSQPEEVSFSVEMFCNNNKLCCCGDKKKIYVFISRTRTNC